MSEPFHVIQPDTPPAHPEWSWFHIILTVYGAWIYGDARGFRTRHHRQHVEGDYKNPPPPGAFAAKEKRSRKLLKQNAVELAPKFRATIGQALVARFIGLGAFLLCAACARQHAHLLTKLPESEARNWSGAAKRHAWFQAREAGWQGKLWANRGHEKPIADRDHQRNTYGYILDHVHEGAWVWDYRRGVIDG